MMISSRFLLLIGLVALLNGDALGLSCKNEKGKSIDARTSVLNFQLFRGTEEPSKLTAD